MSVTFINLFPNATRSSFGAFYLNDAPCSMLGEISGYSGKHWAFAFPGGETLDHGSWTQRTQQNQISTQHFLNYPSPIKLQHADSGKQNFLPSKAAGEQAN